MSTEVRFIGLPRHITVTVKEITEADGRRVTLVVFGNEPMPSDAMQSGDSDPDTADAT